MKRKFTFCARFLCLKGLLFWALIFMFSSPGYGQVYANSQTNGVTGLCLLCDVANPDNPVNNSSHDDYSTFNLTAGLLGVTVYQTLIFPSVSSSGCDSLVIGIGSNNAQLSVNIFGGVTIQTFNGNTANNDTHSVDSSSLHLLQNNTRAQVILHPTQPFDRVKITVSSSLIGLLSGLRLYYAYVNSGKPANPVYTIPEGITCGKVLVPIANFQPGLLYNVRLKYTASPTVLLDTSFTVTNNDTILIPDYLFTIIYQADIYVQAINPFTGCSSDTVHQSFIRGGSAELPVVDADSVTICKGNSATLHAYTPISSLWAIRWYDSPAGGNLLYTGNFYTVSPTVSTTYYVTAASACEYPARKAVTVVVTQLPDPIYTVPEGFVCGHQYLPITNYQSNYVYKVRIVYNSLSTLVLDTSYSVSGSSVIETPNVISIAPAQADVYIQAVDTISNCKSDSVHMQFVQGGSGAYPNVDQDSVTITQGDSVTLHAYVAATTIPTIRWYDAPTGGNLLYSGNYFTVSPAATTVYYVTSAQHCEYPVRRPVKVIVTPKPMAQHAAAVLGGSTVLHGSGDTQGKTLLMAYPNPSSGQFNVQFAVQRKGSVLLQLFTSQGQLIQVLQSGVLDEGIYVINVSNQKLAPGIYFLRLFQNNIEQTSTVIIQ